MRIKNMIMIKNKTGSVGMNMPMPPMSSFSKFSERGVKKIRNQKIFSKDRTAVSKIAATTGSKLNQ
jgi:hypothetical protein